MTRISSRLTFFSKWVFPAMWFGFLAFAFLRIWARAGSLFLHALMGMAVLGMAVLGYLIMRATAWNLADSVEDMGSYLVVRRNGKEARVDLANVMNVSVSTFGRPPRITLTLVHANELGDEIHFSPRMAPRLIPSARCPIGDSLINRVHRARAGMVF